jgi:enterochelin esterase family protein
MKKNALVAFVVGSLFMVLPPGLTSDDAAARLVGRWSGERVFGPQVRGELTLVQQGPDWRTSIVGSKAPVHVDQEALSFVLPRGRAEFRSHKTARWNACAKVPLRPSAQAAEEIRTLTLTTRVERELAGGEAHTYQMTLAPGQVLLVVADQQGVDVVVDTYAPDGTKLDSFDSPNWTEGPEPAHIVAVKPGAYRIVVRALEPDAKRGKYVMRVEGVLTLQEYAAHFARETYQSPRLLRLWQEMQTTRRTPLENFCKGLEGKAPLIEAIPDNPRVSWMTLVWRGDKDTRNVIAVGGPMSAEGLTPLARFEDTDLWYVTLPVSNASRFTYGFEVIRYAPLAAGLSDSPAIRKEERLPDPLNPHRFSGLSYVEMPDAPPQSWIADDTNTLHGKVEAHTLKSVILQEERTFSVYTPPGYAPKRRPYALLVVFDGEVYGTRPQALIPTPVILDNLIARGKIVPTVAVLVNQQGKRERDLPCHAHFVEFLVTEMLPWVRTNYRVTADPRRTVVSGSSLGGLAAAYCGLTHSEVFGAVLSQSGSYWFAPDLRERIAKHEQQSAGWMMDQFAKSRRLPLRFYMEVGRFEDRGSMLETNRHLRDVLLIRGYPVTYAEFEGGHDYVCWRGSLADGLIALLNGKK